MSSQTASSLSVEKKPAPFTAEEWLHLTLGKAYFWYFLDNVFVRSFDGERYRNNEGEWVPFEFSAVHREWALIAQVNPRFCIQASRSHLKTTVIGQGFPFWLMAGVKDGEYLDGLYLAYNGALAKERVADLKRYILGNSYCRFWKDLKPTAESIIDFLVDWGDGPVGRVVLKGAGIKAANRGRHPK
ncbi:hypothetical protein LCGC14_2861790, partial [marine sediment metagenome]